MNEDKFEISVNQEDVQNIINCYEKDIEYIKQLEDNWNKLKEWLENELGSKYIHKYDVLEKLREIEGGMNDR